MKKMVLVGLLAVMVVSVLAVVVWGRSYYSTQVYNMYKRKVTGEIRYIRTWDNDTRTWTEVVLPIFEDDDQPLPRPPRAGSSETQSMGPPILCIDFEDDPEPTKPTTLGDAFAGINAGPSASGSAGVSALDLVNDDNAKKEREEDTTPPGATTVPDGYHPEAY
jgi:hypothetical protein